MNRHPDLDQLNRFADLDLPDEVRGEVASHLQVCTDCRNAVTAYRQLREQYKALPPESLPAGLKDRVMTSLDAGTRVVLPDVPSREERAGNRHPRRAWAVAAVLVLGFAALFTLRAPELASESSELRFSPETPEANERMAVEYRASGRFAGEDSLVLRVRFRSAELSPVMPNPDPVQTVAAQLVRDRDGIFRGEFAVPDGAVYGVFGVEDGDGDAIDTHHGAFWELLVHRSGVPSYDALIQRVNDLQSRNPRAALATTRRMTDLYPEGPMGWLLRGGAEATIYGDAAADSSGSMFEAQYEVLKASLFQQPDVSPSELLVMQRYAGVVVGEEEAALWEERILAEAPRSEEAVEVLTKRVLRRFGGRSPDSSLAYLERLWLDVQQPFASLVAAGQYQAVLADDPAAILRWTERYESYQPTDWPRLINELLLRPTLQDIGITKARAYLADDPLANPAYRRLYERSDEHARRVGRAEVDVYAALGRTLIARGQLDAGSAALERAAALGWNSEVFSDLADARLASGDTLGFPEILARIAVDPSATSADRDAAARRAQRFVTDEGWATMVDEARSLLWEEVMADAKAGPFIPDSAAWFDWMGDRTAIRDVLDDQVSVVVYWYPGAMPDPALRDAAEQIGLLGGKTVAVTTMPPSPEREVLSRGALAGIPLFHDPSGEGARGFEVPGLPSYIVIDHNGRVRFSSVGPTLPNIVQQVAALAAIQQQDVTVD